jgi:hypothetical protein
MNRTSDNSAVSLKTGAAYFGNRFLSHAERDLDELASCCDYVVHTFSETDLQFHKAAVSKIFAATRRRGLEAWADPWGLGGVFGGEALSKFIQDHPEERQVLSDGRVPPAACLNSPAFRAFLREWTLTVLESGAQVIFWDEPHVHFHWDLEWEGVYSCVCRRCRALFKKKFGSDMPKRLNPDARRFRLDTLAGFLREAMIFARRKKMRNALCLYAFEGHEDYENLWNALAAIPELDVFGCDPYWRWPPRRPRPVAAHVAHYAEKTVASVRGAGKGSQIWIQSMRLARGRENEIEAACQAAARAGATHLAAWSYDGGALLDTVLAEDPAQVWAATARAFRKVKGLS